MTTFKDIQRRIRALNTLKQILPGAVGNESRNFFVGAWKNQGFTDNEFKKWEQVKRRIPGTPEYKYPKTKGLGRRTRAINVNTGRLRRSIRIKSQGWPKVVIGTDVEYAGYVNDKRQFIGESKALNAKVKKLIIKEVDKIFKRK